MRKKDTKKIKEETESINKELESQFLNSSYVPESQEEAEKEIKVSEELTDKQDRFIDCYLIHFNPERAAREAGFSPWKARVVGYKLLREPKIREIIDERKKEYKERYTDLQDRVLSAWNTIAFANPKDLFEEDGKLKPMSEIPEDLFFAINSIDTEKKFEGRGQDQEEIEVTKVRLEKKLEALRDLGKHLGMFEKDNSILVDIGFKNIFQMLPPEQRDAVREAAMKKLENKN